MLSSNPSQLILKNNTVFPGLSPAWQKGTYFGEVVFTTGMTGYVESLTDPSYKGQILTFTYPLIGNHGVPDPKTWESWKIHVAGVVVGEVCLNMSHHSAKKTLLEWLKEQKVPIITGVDTRALTKLLRESGVMEGAILNNETRPHPTLSFEKERAQTAGFAVPPPLEDVSPPEAFGRGIKGMSRVVSPNFVAQVTVTKKITYGKDKKKIIVVDCGMKENISRCLREFPIKLIRVPYNYDYAKETFDAIFISNGPGDPMMCHDTVEVLKKAMQRKKPIFGICLGLQLMALASGAKTYKLPYGHRGQNQPCLDLKTKKCYITSQNHGYAVRADSLPKDWRVTMINLNDKSVEGIAHKTLPFFAVQFHPEATPGPTDTKFLFQKFFDSLMSS